ncbi:hypothetical protein [Bartonella sp. AP65SXKL]
MLPVLVVFGARQFASDVTYIARENPSAARAPNEKVFGSIRTAIG